ncbi:MAG: GyrI-like domain-containing protein [Dysgonomonas sp.]|nr:GyrI-like domain-containing protein [Dysgonomonas sp.]
MDYKETTLEAFTVVGISVRTINKDGKGIKDIGELFHRFFAENIIATIPNKISDEFYCIYTDYESDFMGEYTTILGCKVSGTENLPEGLVVKQVPACKYRKYSAQGKIHEAVGQIWTHIWQSPDTDRAYIADFDVYGAEAQNPENAKIYTYLSVK